MIEYIPILIAVIGTLIAAFTDAKTGYVPDKLSHAMIILGIILVPIVYYEQLIMVYSIALAVFAASFLAYLFGQIGGGDMKLFTALALLIPFYPEALAALSQSVGVNAVAPGYPFIISLYVLFGVLYMFFMPAKYLLKIHRIRKKVKDYDKKIIKGITYTAVLIPLFAFWAFLFKPMLLLAPALIMTLLMSGFKDDITKHFFLEKKSVSKLNDDDVLALEFIPEKIRKKLGLWRKTFTGPEIRKIKQKARKNNVKTILVCENMPRAVPYIFAALAINLLLGDFLIYILVNL